jgi:hypothetical protein
MHYEEANLNTRFTMHCMKIPRQSRSRKEQPPLDFSLQLTRLHQLLLLQAIMPHKRAKKSARVADKAAHGVDNVPTSKAEGINAGTNAKYGGLSANMYRILNAEKIRKEKKERDSLKRKRGPGEDSQTSSAKGDTAASSEASKKLKINPGEKLKNFNACVR